MKSLTLSEHLLRDGMSVRISTRGPSMFPLIGTGDLITVRPHGDVTVGDIILFRKGDEIICHRLVKVFEKDGRTYIQTRGDSYSVPDEPVSAEQVLGKVIRIERGDISFIRRVFIFLYPLLRHGVINPLAGTLLRRMKRLLSP